MRPSSLWMSPTAWALSLCPVFALFAVVFGVYALSPSLMALQILSAAASVLVLVFGWIILRKLVLVAQRGRLFGSGAWREMDNNAYVTVSILPWEIVGLPCVVVDLGAGAVWTPASGASASRRLSVPGSGWPTSSE